MIDMSAAVISVLDKGERRVEEALDALRSLREGGIDFGGLVFGDLESQLGGLRDVAGLLMKRSGVGDGRGCGHVEVLGRLSFTLDVDSVHNGGMGVLEVVGGTILAHVLKSKDEQLGVA